VSPRVRLYVEQLCHGHTYLGATGSGIDEFDTSPYRGKIYLYFGLTPFATAWIPLYRFFGAMPGEAALVLFYTLGGSLLYGLATGFVLPNTLRSQRGWWVALTMLVVAFGTGPFVLLRRPALYEVEIAAAFFFVAAFLASTAASCRWTPRHSTLLVTLGSSALALGVGARPNLVLVTPFFLLWIYFQHRSRPSVERFCGAIIPLLLIGGALAAFNFARFQNPLEFGFGHQARSLNTGTQGVFSLGNIPYNAYRYLFGGAHLQTYFPFFAGITPGPITKPVAHDVVDQLYGLAWTTPIVWTAAALCFVRETRRSPVLLLALGVALTQLTVLCCLGGGAYRYTVEIAAPLCWLGVVAVCGWSIEKPKPVRFAAISLTAIASTVSVVLGALQNFALYNILETAHHADFVSLARGWNEPVFVVRHFLGKSLDLPSAEITFPLHTAGVNEPLFVSGSPGLQDFLYVYYVSEKELQIGFESIGRGGTLSPILAVDRTKPHRLTIAYGSLVPPGAPLLHQIPKRDRALLAQSLTVLLDDKPVLDGWADFHPAKELYQFGESRDEGAFGQVFHGTIHPEPVSARVEFWRDRFLFGPWLRSSIKLTKSALPIGTREPVLSLGMKNQGLLFFIEHFSALQARIGCLVSQPGKIEEKLSPPFEWPDQQTREVSILEAPSRADDSLERHALVSVGPSRALDVSFDLLPFAPSTIAVGENRLGLSGITPSLVIPPHLIQK